MNDTFTGIEAVDKSEKTPKITAGVYRVTQITPIHTHPIHEMNQKVGIIYNGNEYLISAMKFKFLSDDNLDIDENTKHIKFESHTYI